MFLFGKQRSFSCTEVCTSLFFSYLNNRKKEITEVNLCIRSWYDRLIWCRNHSQFAIAIVDRHSPIPILDLELVRIGVCLWIIDKDWKIFNLFVKKNCRFSFSYDCGRFFQKLRLRSTSSIRCGPFILLFLKRQKKKWFIYHLFCYSKDSSY